MGFVVYPRLSSTPGALQLLLVDFDVNTARPLQFKLDGVPTTPAVLRPLSSVRGPEDGVKASNRKPRAFTGVYELTGLGPGRVHALEVRLGVELQRMHFRSLPERVPSAEQGGFDVLLASCFHRTEHNPATLTAAVATAKAVLAAKPGGLRTPDCSLFMGDQVYLDLPTLENFPTSRTELAAKFEQNYRANWQTALAPLLSLAPSACVPDDHEFWNNAPHSSPFIGNSWRASGRAAWRAAAQTAFDGFARPGAGTAPPGDDPFKFDVEPLSFFLADGRSGRAENRSHALTPACRQALRHWIDELNACGRVGVFVSGQSYFRKKVGDLSGQAADWELGNYADYQEVVAQLQRAKNRLLVLTGDVHWGRVTDVADRSGRPRLHEVIVSPTSLVSTVAADQVKLGVNWVRDLFGPARRWPRHGSAEAPIAEFGVGASRYTCKVATRPGGQALVQGDQLGMLSFAFDAERRRLRAKITYVSIHHQPERPVHVPLFDAPLTR